MEKEIINYITDILLLISLIAVSVTGIIKLPIILSLLNIARSSPLLQILSKIHDISGVALTLLVLIHLILHWKWLVTMTKVIFNLEKDIP